MTEQDIKAWEREIRHAQMMQRQRPRWDGERPPTATQPVVEIIPVSQSIQRNDGANQ